MPNERESQYDLIESCLDVLKSLPGWDIETTEHPIFRSPHQTLAPDYLVRLLSSWATITYACETREFLTSKMVPHLVHQLRKYAEVSGHKPLLMARHVNDETGKALRQEGIDYVDASGNASLNQPPLYVWLRGFRPQTKPTAHSRAFQLTGLQLVGYLLSRPSAASANYRSLAENAGVSLGSISYILGDLRQQGYIRNVAPHTKGLVERLRLLERWEAGYAEVLRPKIALKQRYRVVNQPPADELLRQITASGLADNVLIGGELAAARLTRYLRPERITLHVHREDMGEIVKKLRLLPDSNGNVHMLQQFAPWNRWEARIDSLQIAHPLLVHAELVSEGTDRRLRETADAIFHDHIQPILGEGDDV